MSTESQRRLYKLVLTGGPCGGKTTGQARLSTFFENMGWKVYRVPETATVLIGGGVKFQDLCEEEVFRFQEDLIKTMMQIEQTFFDLASSSTVNTLVICDRGGCNLDELNSLVNPALDAVSLDAFLACLPAAEEQAT